ncbi:hypothetical protein L2E82_04390 [Cichorium intybus]|uniref:Uncharacterized protein n=1 Tax=Cichorium intybus TaxID=13427 RepID=A0ACB9H6J5_CICIN|nr:hypothetical protein L2E82_04390 [Cichorium intybus]
MRVSSLFDQSLFPVHLAAGRPTLDERGLPPHPLSIDLKLFIVRRGIKSSLKKRQTRYHRGRYLVHKRYDSQNSFCTLEWKRKARPYLFFQACSDYKIDLYR